jgi:hypothetical protein
MASSAPWRRETDSSTGRAYFWHPTTGAARWTLDDSESERFEQATRARDPAKGLLHYQNRLKKAVRLVKFPKIEKFRRKIEKYRAIVSPPPPPPRKGRKKRKTSGFLGVCWDAARGKWKASVKVGDKRIQIGRYDDEEVAARKYNEYVQRHDLGNQLNDVDANGKPLPTTFKRSSRFHGVSWHANRSECQWRAQYRDPRSTPAKTKTCHVGYYSDEEVAALAYNEAVIAAGLDHIRVMNRVDATGRPLPKDQ